MKKKELASMIDHTNLKPTAAKDDILRLCDEAMEWGFRAVCVNPAWVKTCRRRLQKSNVLIAAVNDFPLGCGGERSKELMAQYAKDQGADEIDTVINLGYWDSACSNKIFRELVVVSRVINTKVILRANTIYEKHPDDFLARIKALSAVVQDASEQEFCNIIATKTSTGMGPKCPLKVKVEQIKAMKAGAPNLMVKASGGISSYQAAIRIIKAGAGIIGASAGIKIVQKAR